MASGGWRRDRYGGGGGSVHRQLVSPRAACVGHVLPPHGPKRVLTPSWSNVTSRVAKREKHPRRVGKFSSGAGGQQGATERPEGRGWDLRAQGCSEQGPGGIWAPEAGGGRRCPGQRGHRNCNTTLVFHLVWTAASPFPEPLWDARFSGTGEGPPRGWCGLVLSAQSSSCLAGGLRPCVGSSCRPYHVSWTHTDIKLGTDAWCFQLGGNKTEIRNL